MKNPRSPRRQMGAWELLWKALLIIVLPLILGVTLIFYVTWRAMGGRW